MSDPPKAPYVTWPEHTSLSERVAVQETRLQGIVERFGTQLETASKNYETTHKELTEHRLEETKNWVSVFNKLDSLQKEIKHPMVPVGQEKARIDKFVWKVYGGIGTIAFAVYYIIMIFKVVGH